MQVPPKYLKPHNKDSNFLIGRVDHTKSLLQTYLLVQNGSRLINSGSVFNLMDTLAYMFWWANWMLHDTWMCLPDKSTAQPKREPVKWLLGYASADLQETWNAYKKKHEASTCENDIDWRTQDVIQKCILRDPPPRLKSLNFGVAGKHRSQNNCPMSLSMSAIEAD